MPTPIQTLITSHPFQTRLLGNNINLRNGWNTLLEPVSDVVRNTFRFRDTFTKHAHDRLRRIASDYRERVQGLAHHLELQMHFAMKRCNFSLKR